MLPVKLERLDDVDIIDDKVDEIALKLVIPDDINEVIPDDSDNESLIGLELNDINEEGNAILVKSGVKINDEGVNIRLINVAYSSMDPMLLIEIKDNEKGIEDGVLITERELRREIGKEKITLDEEDTKEDTKDVAEISAKVADGAANNPNKEAGIDDNNKGDDKIAELDEGIPKIIEGIVPGIIDEIEDIIGSADENKLA